MFYKNALIYKLTDILSLDDLQNKLAKYQLREIGAQDLSVMGWEKVIGDSLFHQVGPYINLKLAITSKLLPSSVVNKEHGKKIAEIELAQGCPVGKKQQQDIKQEVINRLLPQAFPKTTYTEGSIFISDGVVVINSGSNSKAESFLAMLRKALGSLPVVPFFPVSLSPGLTSWINNIIPFDKYELGDRATFIDGIKRVVKINDFEDVSQEMTIDMVFEEGFVVTSLALIWDETLSCVVTSEGALKRIKFSDVITEQNSDIPKDQALAIFDADYLLNNAELSRFIKSLGSIFVE